MSLFGGDGTASSLSNKGDNSASLPYYPSSQSNETGNLPSPTPSPPPPADGGEASKDGTTGDACSADCGTTQEPCVVTNVEIDPRGDLTLVVGETRCLCRKKSRKKSKTKEHKRCKTVAFRVCSRAMARAARAFDTMLYGGFAEAEKPDSGWTVSLPDDDPAAMETLLHVMHGRFDAFDSSSYNDHYTQLSDLYRITVLTDKYHLTHLLRPWAEKMSQSLKSETDSLPLFFPGLNGKAIWVSWELGSSDTFKSVIQRLAWESDDNLIPRHFLNALEPPGVSDLISRIRRQAIDDLLRPVMCTITGLMKGQEGQVTYTPGLQCQREGEATSTCNRLTLASLIQSLNSLDLWPLPDAETWDSSASRLQEVLCQLKVQRDPNHYKAIRAFGGVSYGNCGTSLTKDGRVHWCPDILVVLTDEQRKHLERQAAKLGRAVDN